MSSSSLEASDYSSLTTTNYHLRPEVLELQKKVVQFVEQECIPVEKEYEDHMSCRHGDERWTLDAIPPCVERLKLRAKQLGLWNMFIPPHLVSKIPAAHRSLLAPSVSLTYYEYGVLCEILGRCPSIAPEACNTSAPDTGNMEVLLEFGSRQQKQKWLLPLLKGEIRSTFLMTEPNVASSDPTNLETRLMKKRRRRRRSRHVSNNNNTSGSEESSCNDDVVVEDEYYYELKGQKWWSTGAMDPRCRVALIVAKMDYSEMPSTTANHNNNNNNQHGKHTIVVVELPHPRVIMKRPLTVFGYDDAPSGHAEVILDGVMLTSENLILGEGSGFTVSQARLGPGRIHHCMRAVGIAARCYELMLARTLERQTFGKYLWEHGGCQDMIAESVADIESARLLTLSCASTVDQLGVRQSREKIAAIKYAVPELTSKVVDRAVQIYGGAGLSEDYILARALAALRTLRIADGPDAVHKRTVARLQVKKMKQQQQQRSRL